MTYEPWRPPSDAEESRRRVREQRQAIVDELKQFGQEQGATLIAIRQPPPGASGNPGIYRHDREGYSFVFFHKQDEVASTDDSPELQAVKPWRVIGPYEVLGGWAIGRYDLQRRLQEGAVLYTPESYLDLRPYNPQTDPPLIPEPDR